MSVMPSNVLFFFCCSVSRDIIFILAKPHHMVPDFRFCSFYLKVVRPDNWCKRSNSPSLRRPVVDEERMCAMPLVRVISCTVAEI